MSLTFIKSTEKGSNLPISNLFISAFKVAKSDFAASLDASIPVVFFKYVFVA